MTKDELQQNITTVLAGQQPQAALTAAPGFLAHFCWCLTGRTTKFFAAA